MLARMFVLSKADCASTESVQCFFRFYLDSNRRTLDNRLRSVSTIVLEPLANVPDGLDLITTRPLRLIIYDEQGGSDNGRDSDRGR